jgi:siroheme synthase
LWNTDLYFSHRSIVNERQVGSYKGQQTVCGTVDSIADAAEQVEVRAPAVIVIGEVVKLRERLQWFECSGKKLNIFVASA